VPDPLGPWASLNGPRCRRRTRHPPAPPL